MSNQTYKPDERGLITACPDCGRANRLGYERLGQSFRCHDCQTALVAPAVPVEVLDASSFASLTQRSELPVLVDFWAPWCGPCKRVAPELEKVAQAGVGRWVVVKVNTEDLPDLGTQYGVRSIPTMVIFKNGRELTRQSGAMSAAAIQQFIEPSL